jgi:hypothetical protein
MTTCLLLYKLEGQMLDAARTSSSLMETPELNQIDFEDEIEAAVIENDDKSDDSKGGSGLLSSIIKLLLVCGIGYAIFIWLF